MVVRVLANLEEGRTEDSISSTVRGKLRIKDSIWVPFVGRGVKPGEGALYLKLHVPGVEKVDQIIAKVCRLFGVPPRAPFSVVQLFSTKPIRRGYPPPGWDKFE